MTHQELETAVHDQLMQWAKEKGWYFAMRNNNTDRAGRQCFIGAVGRYFCTTFWKIKAGKFTGPVYPIGIVFRSDPEEGIGYQLQGRQARGGQDDQSQAILNIINILSKLERFRSRVSDSDPDNNNQIVNIWAPKSKYDELDEMFRDLETDLSFYIPFIDKQIDLQEDKHPNFIAIRLTEQQLSRYEARYQERLKRPENFNPPDQSILPNTPSILKMASEFPLNQILYGPPGTGKTYTSIEMAVRITNPDFQPQEAEDIRVSVRDEYQRLVSEGRIIFTTFHQSLSYEDFVEGLKPMLEDQGGGEIRYEIKDGIFKEFARSALLSKASEKEQTIKKGLRIPREFIKKSQFFKISLGDVTDSRDDEIYRYCIENNCIALGYGREIDFSLAETEKEIQQALREKAAQEKISSYEIFAVKAFKNWMQVDDLVFVSNGLLNLRAVGRIKGEYYYDPDAPIRYSQFRKVEWLYQDIQFPIKEIYGKQFSQMTIYLMYTEPMKQGLLRQYDDRPSSNNHALIIDEINRGNVSAILGELITLLEPDKRLGRPEALTLTLPYSREEFGVPPNLYIIGTMNTADRSVESLDAALRRRFSFQEIAPNPRVITDVHEYGGLIKLAERTINLATLLATLNQRIAALRDEDHCLGHSYFLKVNNWKDLRDVFRDRIIPLLREYFFVDYAQLQLVVGAGFCHSNDAINVGFAKVDTQNEIDTDVLRNFSFPEAHTVEKLERQLDELGYDWEV